MNKIYADTDICFWHLDQLKSTDIEICSQIDNSITGAVFHVPYPMSADPEFRSRLNQAVKICNKVAVLISELHPNTVDFFKLHQHPNITYFICGSIEHVDSKKWMDWLHRTADFYKRNPLLLNQLNPYNAKEKTFDILLGRNKPHRSAVYNFIKENSLADQVVMTYLKGGETIPLSAQDNQGWIWEVDGFEYPQFEVNWTVTPVRYHDQNISLSQIIPLAVYNQTAYSVVAETNADNHYSFYTEKIVKPILAERLFVVFSGQHYLRNLRELGFRTFDVVINEAYDSVQDNNLRYKMTCEQIQYLIKQPQKEILDKIRPITEYNKRVMLETDWYGDFSRELQALLLDHVEHN